MRFGICSSPDQGPDLAQAGYDYLEWPLRTIAELDDGAYATLLAEARKLPIRAEAFNVMLPGTIKVVGPEVDLSRVRAYLSSAFARAAELGGQVVVFGSGGSRRVPEGWSQEDALAQFDQACALAGEQAAVHGLTIAVEPLNTGETNLINSVAEGRRVVERVGHPSVKVLSDLYHVGLEGEPFEDTAAAGEMLSHVHVSTVEGRGMPLPGREEDVLERYLGAVQAAGYDGRISVEGKWNLDEAVPGLTHLRDMWARVSRGAGT